MLCELIHNNKLTGNGLRGFSTNIKVFLHIYLYCLAIFLNLVKIWLSKTAFTNNVATMNSLLSIYCYSHLCHWRQLFNRYFAWTHPLTDCIYFLFHPLYWHWAEKKAYCFNELADSPTDCTTAISCRRVTPWEMSSDFPVTSAFEFS
jgi:hypothetical protein